MDADVMTRYHNAVESILSQYEDNIPGSNSRGPARILKYLYLGDFGDANSLGQLSELGITHLLNCAGVYTGNRLLSGGGASGMRGYRQLEAHDNEKYDMLSHYKDAEMFIEDARKNGGKVLVYCARGVNRSAAICTAYLMARADMDLCRAVDNVALARGAVLTNPGFRKQLVMFAKERACLDPS